MCAGHHHCCCCCLGLGTPKPCPGTPYTWGQGLRSPFLTSGHERGALTHDRRGGRAPEPPPAQHRWCWGAAAALWPLTCSLSPLMGLSVAQHMAAAHGACGEQGRWVRRLGPESCRCLSLLSSCRISLWGRRVILPHPSWGEAMAPAWCRG